jgi:hypothetical protein
MTKNLNGLLPDQLEDLYLEVKAIREKVLELIEPYGYSASQLVSRHFENEIEKLPLTWINYLNTLQTGVNIQMMILNAQYVKVRRMNLESFTKSNSIRIHH